MRETRIVLGILYCSVFFAAACSSQPVAVVPENNPILPSANLENKKASSMAPEALATVETLSRDILKLQKELTRYIEPLTPEQESEVKALRKELSQRETQRAQLELKNMIDNWEEE